MRRCLRRSSTYYLRAKLTHISPFSLRRLTETPLVEADRLSVWLLANAGYDPASAIRFWERFGREHGEGLISDGTHARWKERAKAIDEEIARLPTAATRDGAKVPPILTQPLPSLK